MSDRQHHPLASILAHEDLDAAERRRADDHLATCPECRDLLARLRDLEGRAAAVPGLPGLEVDPLADLSLAERAAAEASHRQLLTRVAGGKGRRWAPVGFGGVLALAAAFALILFGPWRSSGPDASDAFADLRLGPAVVMRDDGAAAAPVAPGEAVALRFTPSRAGWPVVVRLQAADAEVLCPTDDTPGWRLPADRPAVVPPPGSGVVWRAAPDESTARWLVALSPAPVDDPEALARSLAAALDGQDDAQEQAAAWLEGRFGAVGVVVPR